MPGAEGVEFVIHAAPQLGARFTQMTAEFVAGGSLGPAPAERFLYVLDGRLEMKAGAKRRVLAPGGFAYLPQGVPHTVRATGIARAAVIEKPYEPQPGADAPEIVIGNEAAIAADTAHGRSCVCGCAALMPDGPAYDFAVNTMTYDPGAALSMVEIHVMEHGLLMLEGGGIYRLGDAWYPVHAGDFIWMRALLPAMVRRAGQAAGKISHLQRLVQTSSGSVNRGDSTKTHPQTIDRQADGGTDGSGPDHRSRAPGSDACGLFGEADRRARAYVKGLCAAAGLTVSEDAVGNTFARWQGSDPALAPIGTGSHIDAIPNAGLYDGCVGVLGGLEAIRVLQQLGFKPRRSIELVIFTAEEPTRFGIGCLGSRMMAGLLTPAQALALRDKEGRGLEELRAQAGFTRAARIRSGSSWTLSSIHRVAHRARTAARTGRHRPRPCDAHRRAGQPAHRHRRRRRTRRRQAHAGAQRRTGRRG